MMLASHPVRIAAWLILLVASSLCQGPTSKKFHLDGNTAWTDTGIDLEPQDQLTIEAAGSLTFNDKESTPDGLARGWRDLLRALPLESGGTAALIGRIGAADTPLFLIGTHMRRPVGQGGRLFLGINRLQSDVLGGAGFDVAVQVGRQSGTTTQAASAKLVDLPAGALSFPDLPSRVNDGKGHDGDAVNLIVVGSKEQVIATFGAAQWEQSDKSIKDAVLHGTLSSLSKDAYLAMPMSKLVLFGRTQDLAFEHAEAVAIAASRRPLRRGAAPLFRNRDPLAVVAHTHDNGFHR